jgi:hypothetical protein
VLPPRPGDRPQTHGGTEFWLPTGVWIGGIADYWSKLEQQSGVRERAFGSWKYKHLYRAGPN